MPLVLTPDNKKALVNSINDSGKILEHTLGEILKKRFSGHIVKQNYVIYEDGIRKEIDAILEHNSLTFIFEYKHSIFDWFFPTHLNYPKNIYIITNHNANNIQIQETIAPWSINVSGICREISIDQDGEMHKRTYDKGRHKGEEFAVTSARDEFMESKTQQLILNTQAYLNSVTPVSTENRTYIPVLVTNANLYYTTYGELELNKLGNLSDLKDCNEVNDIAYNIPEILSLKNIPINSYTKNNLHGTYVIAEHLQLKTVFIVNSEHLTNFVEMIINGNRAV